MCTHLKTGESLTHSSKSSSDSMTTCQQRSLCFCFLCPGSKVLPRLLTVSLLAARLRGQRRFFSLLPLPSNWLTLTIHLIQPGKTITKLSPTCGIDHFTHGGSVEHRSRTPFSRPRLGRQVKMPFKEGFSCVFSLTAVCASCSLRLLLTDSFRQTSGSGDSSKGPGNSDILWPGVI